MNNTKTNPVGIDLIIQDIQNDLYDKLSVLWGDIKGFGRVYKNKKQERTIPEYYAGKGEYDEVLTDDMKTATFFFLESGELESKGSCLSKTNVELYFLVDVSKAKSSIQHYADEEVRLDVLNIVKNNLTIVRTIKGRDALSSFTVEDLDFIHPYFIFKIEGIINNY